jgi:DNA primase
MTDYIDPEELGLQVFGYSGDEALVKCPYHDDHHPSARFNVKTGLFHCFVCGTGKRAKDIEREFGGSILRGGLEMDALRYATMRAFDEPTIDWRSRFLNLKLAEGSVYLAGRGVSSTAIEKLQIRECDNGDIVFPLFSDKSGTIGGVQIRQLHNEPKYVFYGEKPGIYPLTGMPPRGNAYLVEGIFSVIRGRDAGFEVFATMGSASLAPALKYFYDRTKIFGIFDPDEAGYIACAKLTSIGIACLETKFEADEQSIEDWRKVIHHKNNFTMKTRYFLDKILATPGIKVSSIADQILKFEKENL